MRGQGIFKSADYGDTWTQLASTDNIDFFYVQKVAATRHRKKQRIYAATRTGVFRSMDGGARTGLRSRSGEGCLRSLMQAKAAVSSLIDIASSRYKR